jgi:hypothetical protein
MFVEGGIAGVVLNNGGLRVFGIRAVAWKFVLDA